MNDLLLKAFDFGIRVVELANYLNEEGKQFPLINRLLESGSGFGVLLRISKDVPRSQQDSYLQALKQACEAEYILEVAVKTGYLTEIQGEPLLRDCRSIKDSIKKIIGDKAR